MKKLLESCLSLIDSAGDMFARPADNWEAEASRVRSAVRTALAALEPGATPAAAILAQADRLEDEGDERAQAVRAVLSGGNLVEWINATRAENDRQPLSTGDVAMIGHTNSPNINVYWQSPFVVIDRDRQS